MKNAFFLLFLFSLLLCRPFSVFLPAAQEAYALFSSAEGNCGKNVRFPFPKISDAAKTPPNEVVRPGAFQSVFTQRKSHVVYKFFISRRLSGTRPQSFSKNRSHRGANTAFWKCGENPGDAKKRGRGGRCATLSNP